MQGIKPGWHETMSMEDYIELAALSASGVEEFRRSPLHYQHYVTAPRETTRAMELGTALHLVVLEPDLFERKYVVAQPCEAILGSGLRKGQQCAGESRVLDPVLGWLCGMHGKGSDCKAISGGHAILSREEWAATQGMRAAIHAHETASKILSGLGALEITGVWEDSPTGVLCKMRPDRIVARASLHVNIKTTRDASIDPFTRDAAGRGYHRREAFYRRGFSELGTDIVGSAIIAVENTPPHAVAAYIYDESQLASAGEEVNKLIRDYAICLDLDEWPGYSGEFQHLNIPAWAQSVDTEESVFGQKEVAR